MSAAKAETAPDGRSLAGRSKRYRSAAKLLPADAQPLAEAVAAVRKAATAKFDETIEVAVRLGVDPKQSDQVVRGTVLLPHGTGSSRRVVVFAKGDKEKEATAAGADHVGAEELMAKIMAGWTDFDVAVATPDLMREVGKLGKVLGPRGLMPNPKTGTVTNDVARIVKELKAGRIEFKTNAQGIVHAAVGKRSFETEKLIENARVVLEALLRAKPAAVKGSYVRSVAVAPTMGPSVRVDPARIGVE